MRKNHAAQEIELLAPAGTFDIAIALLDTPCDAIYLGGPYLNMRMIRKGYNLSLEELAQIVPMAHARGKKLYVTLNNMLSEAELTKTREYLHHLQAIQPDGLIIQDFAIFKLLQEESISLPLHGSVMINAHNLESIYALEGLGVSRVVLSRELSLQDVRNLADQTDIELEYFTHGDMCSVHGSLCYYSSFLFGMSSNRGRCLKPCRWKYQLEQPSGQSDTPPAKIEGVHPHINDAAKNPVYKGYPLAVKDMSMIEHIPEMLAAGVRVFKIEGRMRQKEFIIALVTHYANALDKALTQGESYHPEAEAQWIFEHRKRDLSTGYAFGNPRLTNLNQRHEGTGALYSTGKVFSSPTKEPEISETLNTPLTASESITPNKPTYAKPSNPKQLPLITVEVTNLEQLQAVLTPTQTGGELVSRIYLSLEGKKNTPLAWQAIENLIQTHPNSIWLKTPTMLGSEQKAYLAKILQKQLPFAGIACTHISAIELCKAYNYPLHGEHTLNIYNSKALETYKKLGITSATLSIESPYNNTKQIAEENQKRPNPIPLEIIAHGRPTVMYLDHSLFHHQVPSDDKGPSKDKTPESLQSSADTLVLASAEKQEAYLDQWNKTHILTGKELSFLPLRHKLATAGIGHVRILGGSYRPYELTTIIKAYQSDKEVALSELPTRGHGFTLGALGI